MAPSERARMLRKPLIRGAKPTINICPWLMLLQPEQLPPRHSILSSSFGRECVFMYLLFKVAILYHIYSSDIVSD